MGDRRRKEESNHQQATRPESNSPRRSWLCLAVALAVVAIAVPLCAQQSKIYRDGNSWVEEITGTLPTTRELRVFTDLGSVQVQGNYPRVSYTIRKRSYAASEKDARHQFEQLHISASKGGDFAVLNGKLGKKALARFGAEFVVQVPRELSLLKVQTRMGSLAFSSIAATIVANTGAGLIKLDDLAGPVKIASGGGNVEAGNLGSDLTLTSGAADVRVANVNGLTQVSLAGGRVYIGTSHASTIQTGAGSIQVQKCMGDLHVISGGGNLYLGDVDGSVIAQTEGGSVRLASATGQVQVTTGGGSVSLYKLSRGAQVETGAGPIAVEFLGNRGFTDSFLHTASGDVTVCLAPNLPVSLHATSDMVSGAGISSDFSGLNITRTGGQWGPRSMYAEGALNGGGPVLRIRTTIGQIALHRCQ